MDNGIGVAFTVLLPLLLIGEAVLAFVAWRFTGHRTPEVLRHPMGGPGGRPSEVRAIGMWLGLTVVSLWLGFLAAFVGVHALLFTFGTGPAFVGLIVSAIALAAVPLAWGVVIARQARQR
jgi:hypothetical protein